MQSLVTLSLLESFAFQLCKELLPTIRSPFPLWEGVRSLASSAKSAARRCLCSPLQTEMHNWLDFFPSPVGRGFKVRDLTQRTIFFGRDSRFRSGTVAYRFPRSKSYPQNPFSAQRRNLESREKARWTRSLTLILSPRERGRALAELCKGPMQERGYG